MRDSLPLGVTHEVRDRCLCLHLQRAARVIGRCFDDALRRFDLTNGQFSLLMSLNRQKPPRIGDVAPLLGMDRTTLTANLKPLARRGLLTVLPDSRDKRSRRLCLTDAGRDLLAQAVPTWRTTHDEIDRLAHRKDAAALRADLAALSLPR
ncbi:MAG: MarR family transcriptional regulator [Proteobacteria bacterium]|nr:MarR family transcriptional regulator [Pseudomonadota bacterium]